MVDWIENGTIWTITDPRTHIVVRLCTSNNGKTPRYFHKYELDTLFNKWYRFLISNNMNPIYRRIRSGIKSKATLQMMKAELEVLHGLKTKEGNLIDKITANLPLDMRGERGMKL